MKPMSQPSHKHQLQCKTDKQQLQRLDAATTSKPESQPDSSMISLHLGHVWRMQRRSPKNLAASCPCCDTWELLEPCALAEQAELEQVCFLQMGRHELQNESK